MRNYKYFSESTKQTTSKKENGALIVPFFYDYKSPFSYLISDKVKLLQHDYNISVQYLPYHLDIEGVGLGFNKFPNKTKYLYLDARRWATAAGKKVFGPGKVYNSCPACVGALFAQRSTTSTNNSSTNLNEVGFVENNPKFFSYHDYLFTTFWENKEPKLAIDDFEVVTSVLVKLQIISTDQQMNNWKIFSGLNTNNTSSSEGMKLIQAIQEKADRVHGVFGVPSLVVDGELFFGNDRVDWVQKKLEKIGLKRN